MLWGGIRGVLDKNKERLVKDTYLDEWVDQPLKERLEKELHTKFYFENDSELIGLGEAISGAGRGYGIVAYLTISTGVGGVRIVERKVDEHTYGFEPGHQIIDVDGTINPDTYKKEKDWNVGELESIVSGIAIKLHYGKDPHEITDEKIWQEISRYLAVGVYNTVIHWSPDVVVLGGGMMKSPGILIDVVKSHLRQILKIFPKHPEIKKAELGDFGGLYGALEYIKQQNG